MFEPNVSKLTHRSTYTVKHDFFGMVRWRIFF